MTFSSVPPHGLVEGRLTRRPILGAFDRERRVEAHYRSCLSLGVDLWCLRVGELSSTMLADPQALGILSEAELARHERFRFQKDRDGYMAKRLLVRGVLSEYGERSPESWRFVDGEHGRPGIAPECRAEGLEFNLSSSGGVAVCVVARDRAIGVDVEDLCRPDTYDLTKWVLAPEERHRLEQLPEPQRRTAFLRYWTLKEAYVKARGLGLTLPVADVAFDYDMADEITVFFARGIEDDPRRWRFVQMRLFERYIVALSATF